MHDQDVKRQTINEKWQYLHLKCQVPLASSSVQLLVSFFKSCFCRRHKQRRRLLIFELSISSSPVFYKKMDTLKIMFDEDLMV